MLKSKISKDFGKFVNFMRNKKQINKTHLSKQSMVSRYTIIKIESGIQGMSLDNAFALIKALGTSFSEFEEYLNNKRGMNER